MVRNRNSLWTERCVVTSRNIIIFHIFIAENTTELQFFFVDICIGSCREIKSIFIYDHIQIFVNVSKFCCNVMQFLYFVNNLTSPHQCTSNIFCIDLKILLEFFLTLAPLLLFFSRLWSCCLACWIEKWPPWPQPQQTLQRRPQESRPQQRWRPLLW